MSVHGAGIDHGSGGQRTQAVAIGVHGPDIEDPGGGRTVGIKARTAGNECTWDGDQARGQRVTSARATAIERTGNGHRARMERISWARAGTRVTSSWAADSGPSAWPPDSEPANSERADDSSVSWEGSQVSRMPKRPVRNQEVWALRWPNTGSICGMKGAENQGRIQSTLEMEIQRSRAKGAILFAMRSGERCQRSGNAEVSGANRGRKLEVMVGTKQAGGPEAKGSLCGGGQKQGTDGDGSEMMPPFGVAVERHQLRAGWRGRRDDFAVPRTIEPVAFLTSYGDEFLLFTAAGHYYFGPTAASPSIACSLSLRRNFWIYGDSDAPSCRCRGVLGTNKPDYREFNSLAKTPKYAIFNTIIKKPFGPTIISKIPNFVALNKIFYVPFKLLHGKFQATTTIFCATVITFDGCSGHRSRWRSTLLPEPPAAPPFSFHAKKVTFMS
ncbi:hypothetical protein DFH08DRAFT_1002113 [Mycena albidolilacea]|uniref:Uncharacterized protein n=1 Tax=Mycena albidolilacea TaxID=1033008 RepID=A0AAD7ERD8_9AGAR|nr:hypothetical protein DFH08DRAFT_1002113 [Mycena albidolilacea]